MGRLILGLDFDGTVVTHRFPEIGQDAPDAVRVIKRLIEEKGFIVVLNTMRSNSACYNPETGKTIPYSIGKLKGLPTILEDAIKWFERNGIKLSGINSSPGQKSWTTSPKVYATHYIDDAAVGTPLLHFANGEHCVDWKWIEDYFFKGE